MQTLSELFSVGTCIYFVPQAPDQRKRLPIKGAGTLPSGPFRWGRQFFSPSQTPGEKRKLLVRDVWSNYKTG